MLYLLLKKDEEQGLWPDVGREDGQRELKYLYQTPHPAQGREWWRRAIKAQHKRVRGEGRVLAGKEVEKWGLRPNDFFDSDN